MSGAPKLEVAAPRAVDLLQRSLPAAAWSQRPGLCGLWEDALLGPLRDFLHRPGKAFRAQLVDLGYRLADGAPGGLPTELPQLLELLHAGSLIIDDIEDGSAQRRGGPSLHREVGTPLALNAGNWLYFLPFEVLAGLGLRPDQRLLAHDYMHACLSRCHEGQALDLHVRIGEADPQTLPSVVEAVTRSKTGSLVGLAMALGAVAADAPRDRVEALHGLGIELGMALQMLDDLSGVLNPARREKGIEDLREQSPTWVWAWLAQDLDTPSYRRLVDELRAATSDEEARAMAEALGFRVGASGRSRVRQHVERALTTFVEVHGEHPQLVELTMALKKLERGYVEG